ncbi:MAG: hypothetical protein U5L46_12350 [Agrobacterium sp.]|nr:hypothetical protein [Agrobacterium sp.]
MAKAAWSTTSIDPGRASAKPLDALPFRHRADARSPSGAVRSQCRALNSSFAPATRPLAFH